MLTYALGRGLERDDRCAVDEIARNVVQKNDYRVLEPGARDREERPVPDATGKARGRNEQAYADLAANGPEGSGGVHGPAVAGGDAAAGGVGAAAPTTAPLRMAFLYVPNGINMADWTPKEDGAGFDLPPTLEPLASRSRTTCMVLDRPDARTRPGRTATAPATMPAPWPLPHRPPAAQDRRRRHPRRHLRRSARRRRRSARPRASPRWRSAARAARSRQLRFRLQLRLFVEHLLARRSDADAEGGQPQAGLRPPVRHGAQRRRRTRPAASATSRASSISSAKTPSSLQATLGANDQRKLDEYLTGVREIGAAHRQGAAGRGPGAGRDGRGRRASRRTTRNTSG